MGGVFQDQFKSVLIESNEQLLWTSFYIHKNPLEAGLVEDLTKYEWNSYLEYYSDSKKEGICSKEIILGQFNSPTAYSEYFEGKNKEITSFQDLYFDFEED